MPIAFRGTVIFSATFPSLTAMSSPCGSPLSFFFRPFMPMMQSTLPNNSAQVSLTAAPRRSVAPLGTSSTSCKRFPHRLCVAVKFGVCVCECGKVTALKASAYHRLEPPVPRCMDFNRFVLRQWCFGRLQVARAPRSAYVGITFCCSFALVLTLRVFIR